MGELWTYKETFVSVFISAGSRNVAGEGGAWKKWGSPVGVELPSKGINKFI